MFKPTTSKHKQTLAGLAFVFVFGLACTSRRSIWRRAGGKGADAPYDPAINPVDFTTDITNKYFSLRPGAKFTYTNKSFLSTERILVEVTQDTKMVMGVKTVVVRDRVWVGDVLKEDTEDYYAQDKVGNVWYFGEDDRQICER